MLYFFLDTSVNTFTTHHWAWTIRERCSCTYQTWPCTRRRTPPEDLKRFWTYVWNSSLRLKTLRKSRKNCNTPVFKMAIMLYDWKLTLFNNKFIIIVRAFRHLHAKRGLPHKMQWGDLSFLITMVGCWPGPPLAGGLVIHVDAVAYHLVRGHRSVPVSRDHELRVPWYHNTDPNRTILESANRSLRYWGRPYITSITKKNCVSCTRKKKH